MMKRYAISLCIIFCAIFSKQIFANERWLQGEVVIRTDTSAEPQVNVTVTIKEAASSDTTNFIGKFRLFLPKIFMAGEEVTLFVDKPGWVIYRPLDGKVRIPSDTNKDLITLFLVPKSSPLLLSYDRIEKLISDFPRKSTKQVASGRKPVEIDFSPYIEEWAVQYGFSVYDVMNKVEKWIQEVEDKSSDLYELGLVAYAKKNFGLAATKFRESGKDREKQLARKMERRKRLEEEEKELIKGLIRDFGLEGDSHYSNYQFKKALIAYKRSFAYINENASPRLWASTLINIGYTDWQIGIRTKGSDSHRYIRDAIDAYNSTLAIYTKEHLPQDWAATQNNLGVALQDQGIRTVGKEGLDLLTQAVKAYRNALEIYTKEHLPQDWAGTQYNLGSALYEKGRMSESEKSIELFAGAISAYKKALEVREFEWLPLQWAQTQYNLARVYLEVNDQENAAESFSNVLKLYPNYSDEYNYANFIYHEVLFKFDRAFALNKQWLTNNPDDISGLCNYAEAHITTGRFDESEKRIDTILEMSNILGEFKIALLSIGIANLVGQGKVDAILGKLDNLRETVAEQPEEFVMKRSFKGVKHFINNNSRFELHRDWLTKLFDAMEGGNRDSIIDELESIKSSFEVRSGNKDLN